MKRVRVAIVVVCVALAGMVVWQLVKSSAEPVYEGKTLTQWLEGLLNEEPPAGQYPAGVGPEEAILQMGTNAVPALVRLCRTRDSEFKLRVMRLLARQHLFKVRYRPAVGRPFTVCAGFRVLGTNAQAAVPDLIRIASENTSLDFRCCAIVSLGYIGPAAQQAVPYLLQWSTNADLRPYALGALNRINSEAAIKAGGDPIYKGIPLRWWLTGCDERELLANDDTHEFTYWGKDGRDSIEAIAQIGTNAVPTLLSLLRFKDAPFTAKLLYALETDGVAPTGYYPARTWNRRALIAFEILGTNAVSALPALIEIADENISADSRACAIKAIGWMGPRAKEAVPALMRWMTNYDCGAICALGSIGTAAKPAVPWLLQHVRDSNGTNYIYAVKDALWLIDPAAANAGITNWP